MTRSCLRTLRLKVRRESYRWLEAAAIEVNQVFNYCNDISFATATPTDRKRKWLSGFDLCNLTAGASEYFEHIGADTIQRVCTEYAKKQAKRLHRTVARQRRDACHKFSRTIVDRYQNILIGDVSSLKLAKTRMAKSVLDSGWGMLRRMLQYKGEHAGRVCDDRR